MKGKVPGFTGGFYFKQTSIQQLRFSRVTHLYALFFVQI